MATYTTEITSDKLISDNPIHQRLLKAYIAATPFIEGKLLEIGCGEGRGVEILAPKAESYLGLDKIPEIVRRLQEKYPQYRFQQAIIPPLQGLPSSTYDTVVSFQVIEHIEEDDLFLNEIHRVLKPGGQAIISTPNIKYSLTRNPWHIREYTPEALKQLCEGIFTSVETMGIGGNKKVWSYHDANRLSVRKFTRWDIFNLQYRLPATWLRFPYEVLNRINRNLLHKSQGKNVTGITHEDYPLLQSPEQALDLYYILKK
ncbi:class I SAM-dependent methyltransferase [Pleomorphovibrio marinus]|uniref:class I SAM-dependent methyltransferase n=1 Tax=Pleomorphovibrio marinus TaxID=2164132 RepID=UPI000E0BD3AA|nr:class I SAM-dependent methyltransferase [Pleomorphovibrio marinus]